VKTPDELIIFSKNRGFAGTEYSTLPFHRVAEEVQMASIEERARDLIVEQLGVDQEQVTPQASFIDDLGADSLDTVELVMAFEEEFGIDIPDEDAEKMLTVGDAIKYLEENSKA